MTINFLSERIVAMQAIRLIFCFFTLALFANSPKICLNMIVKNESPVIEECLNSVKHWVDTWVIVDTGSTDGTQEIIAKTMAGIPGELHQRPWVDFSHNRNEAMELAKDKGDFLLLIDADEILKEPKSYQRPELTADCYAIYVKNPMADSVYQKAYLLSTHVDWKWVGVLHEGLTTERGKTCGVLSDLLLDSNSKGGARTRDPDKFKKDIAVFEKALKDEPGNSRYMYYLGQCYNCDQNYPKALEVFKKRSEMKDSEEEVYHSLYMIGNLQEKLGEPAEEVIASYSKAFAYRPSRAEPVFRLAQYYNKQKKFPMGYLLCKLATSISKPLDMTYLETWVYEYGALSEMAHSAFWLGHFDESESIYKELLAKELPPTIRSFFSKNLEQVNLRKTPSD